MAHHAQLLRLMNANAQPPATSLPEENTARLLEQLMSMARYSALEEMASGIAHELNQPMGAITTFAQAAERMLARNPPMVAEALDVLRHIADEALGAGQGIHRIRKLFNDREAARETCSLAEVLDELLPVMTLLADRAGMRLDVQVQPGLSDVSIDRLRIQHVLFTLLQNALEVPHQPGAERIITVALSGDRYEVRTSVEDHGVGLTEEQRTQLFRPFFTTKRQGTGLGLASSRAIIEAHQGNIGVKELAAGGTSFWFSLPASVETSSR
jgi:C4-dicarboxylate-specific signal transduction histidine kinase